MHIFFLNQKQLEQLIANARYFEGYYVRSRNIGPDKYKVTTNYNYVVSE